MRKILFIIIFSLITLPVLSAVLQTGVEIRKIPNAFYGNWRVSSTLASSNNPAMFKQRNVDFWNISRFGDVIKLENPFSGASQSVTVQDVNNNFIKFTKVGNYSGKKLTDEVTITLKNNTFFGVNELKLDTISDIDGHVLKTDRATYNLKGEKLSGTSIGD